MKILDRTDLHDILYGCVILGCGGGGSLERSLRLIDEALDAGKVFRLASFDEIPDDDYIATPYYCGAVSPETEEVRKKYAGLPLLPDEPALKAVRELERLCGIDVKGVISTELGGGNTGVALYVGAMLGKYVVDGDPAGRSVPELQHSTYYLNDVPMTPISVVNLFGESAVFTNVVNDFRAETLVRALAVASKNRLAVVDHPATGAVIKKSVIGGAISNALDVGRAWRTAREEKADVAEAVARAGVGSLLLRGTLDSFEWDTVEGFTVGNLHIRDDVGRKFKIWFKNEHIVSWLDEEPYVTAPDLICLFDATDGRPLTNPYYEAGMRIDAIVLPAPKEWTTRRGLEVFGPESFGFEISWRPFAEILKG